jgi:small subunit ribosomal protein S9
MPDEERQDEPREEGQVPEAEGEEPTTAGEDAGEPAAETPEAEPDETPAPDEAPAPEEAPAADEPAAAEAPGGAEPGAEPAAETPAPRARPPRGEERKDEVVPGAHLEPDLVLEEQQAEEADQYAAYAEEEPAAGPAAEAPAEAPPPSEERPAPRTPLELAADARYRATGKRKTSVARVILKPGSGQYSVNGRPLEQYFPRARLQHAARQPLETAGYESRMDVVARIHGGGVSAQAGALRHGIARALVEADPNLRGDLKRRGLLTRDARQKERKKAGLKKARKRPQFSKR